MSHMAQLPGSFIKPTVKQRRQKQPTPDQVAHKELQRLQEKNEIYRSEVERIKHMFQY